MAPQRQMDLRLDTLSLKDQQAPQRQQHEHNDFSDDDALSPSSDYDSTTSTTNSSPSRETFYTPSNERRHVHWSAELVEIINRSEQQQQSRRSSSVLQKLRSPFARSKEAPITTPQQQPRRRSSYITRKPSKQTETAKPRTSSW